MLKLLKLKTKGDHILDKPISEIGGKGIFTKELQNALLDKVIIALFLEPATPQWLKDLGANPVKLGLDLSGIDENALAKLFSGNILPEQSTPFSQAYAGHQFGHFTLLGDGRAHLLGEHITKEKKRLSRPVSLYRAGLSSARASFA